MSRFVSVASESVRPGDVLVGRDRFRWSDIDKRGWLVISVTAASPPEAVLMLLGTGEMVVGYVLRPPSYMVVRGCGDR